jgi:hypothetical protein
VPKNPRDRALVAQNFTDKGLKFSTVEEGSYPSTACGGKTSTDCSRELPRLQQSLKGIKRSPPTVHAIRIRNTKIDTWLMANPREPVTFEGDPQPQCTTCPATVTYTSRYPPLQAIQHNIPRGHRRLSPLHSHLMRC